MADELKLLDELEALEKKATPAPWKVRGDDGRCNAHVEYVYQHMQDMEGDEGNTIVTVWDRGKKQNRYFIAAARNALPLLIRLARRGLAAGEECERLRLAIMGASDTCSGARFYLNETNGPVADAIRRVAGLYTDLKLSPPNDAALSRLAEKEGA